MYSAFPYTVAHPKRLKVPTNATVSFRNSMSIQQYVCNDVCTLTIEVCDVRNSEYFHCLSLVPPPLLFHEETKAWPYRASEESLAQSDFVLRAKNPLPNRISVSTGPSSVCFLQTFEEPDPQLNRHLSCSKAIETLHNIS